MDSDSDFQSNFRPHSYSQYKYRHDLSDADSISQKSFDDMKEGTNTKYSTRRKLKGRGMLVVTSLEAAEMDRARSWKRALEHRIRLRESALRGSATGKGPEKPDGDENSEREYTQPAGRSEGYRALLARFEKLTSRKRSRSASSSSYGSVRSNWTSWSDSESESDSEPDKPPEFPFGFRLLDPITGKEIIKSDEPRYPSPPPPSINSQYSDTPPVVPTTPSPSASLYSLSMFKFVIDSE